MNIYWVYDLPIWLFGALTIAVTVAIALGGFYATRKWVRRVHRDQHSHRTLVRREIRSSNRRKGYAIQKELTLKKRFESLPLGHRHWVDEQARLLRIQGEPDQYPTY